MTKKESKALNIENQAIITSKSKTSKGRIYSVDQNMTQSSGLRPQSLNPDTDHFKQVCVELLREGHGVKFRAPGGSMYPTICDGDLITVEPINPSDIASGDIILYRHQSGVTAHRVMRILKRSAPKGPQGCSSTETLQFLLRGDAAFNDDDPVHDDQILGKVVSIERNCRPLNPYCHRLKFLYKARRLAVRLKRVLFSHRPTQTDTDHFRG